MVARVGTAVMQLGGYWAGTYLAGGALIVGRFRYMLLAVSCNYRAAAN